MGVSPLLVRAFEVCRFFDEVLGDDGVSFGLAATCSAVRPSSSRRSTFLGWLSTSERKVSKSPRRTASCSEGAHPRPDITATSGNMNKCAAIESPSC